jgi:hypothetical protein
MVISGQPTRSSPEVGSERASSTFNPWRISLNTVTPQLSSATPCVVSSTPCELRSNNRPSKVRSSSEMVLETTGCETESWDDAFFGDGKEDMKVAQFNATTDTVCQVHWTTPALNQTATAG